MNMQSMTDGSPTIETLKPSLAGDWDAYVRAHRFGSFFHLSAWAELIEGTLGQRCHFLIAKRGARVVGLLPLVEVRTWLFGHALVSTGFTVGGGPLADNRAIEALLLDQAERLAHAFALDRIEIRGPMVERAGFERKSQTYAGFVQALDPDVDANLARIRRKQRAIVRKAHAVGLTVSIERHAARFMPLYASSLHRHGTPMLPDRFYHALIERFGGDCDVLILEHDGEPVAGVMSFYFQGVAMPYYAGGLPMARKLGAHDLMYFELMRHALASKGCTHFDFGRSKTGTGSFDFKRHWGFTPEPLTYSYKTSDGDSAPEINPLNPRYRRKTQIWRQLPTSVVGHVGPWLARQIG